MNTTDRNSLYVLICSLAGTLISLPAVWYFTAAHTQESLSGYRKHQRASFFE